MVERDTAHPSIPSKYYVPYLRYRVTTGEREDGKLQRAKIFLVLQHPRVS